MTVIKLSKSGKGFEVIDDVGNVYLTSVEFVLGLLEGKSRTGIVYMKRLPYPVPGRFRPSELMIMQGQTVDPERLEAIKALDHMDKKAVQAAAETRGYEDKSVWE